MTTDRQDSDRPSFGYLMSAADNQPAPIAQAFTQAITPMVRALEVIGEWIHTMDPYARAAAEAQFAYARALDAARTPTLDETEAARLARERADALARDLLPPWIYEKLRRRASFELPSTLVPGRTYHVPTYTRGRVVAWDRNGATATLCAQPQPTTNEGMAYAWIPCEYPIEDWVVFQYLQITYNERAWLNAARVLWTDGGPWARVPRRRARHAYIPRLVRH